MMERQPAERMTSFSAAVDPASKRPVPVSAPVWAHLPFIAITSA
jgi:hypothetical protein